MSKITIRAVDGIDYVGIPFCPPSFFDTSTINFSVNWGDGSISTITSDDDPAVEKNATSGALTLKHSYVSSGNYKIVIDGGYGPSGSEKLAFAQCSKQNSEGVAEYYYGRGALSTPDKFWKIFDLENFYIHGQGDFKDFTSLTTLACNASSLLPLTSASPESQIQLTSGSGSILLNQTFENTGDFSNYLGFLDTTGCVSMQSTFKNSDFNSNIGGWDFSSVVNATSFLEGTTSFTGQFPNNKNLSGLTWTALENASSMFKNSSFNCWINGWFKNSNNLVNVTSMFEGASFYDDNTSSVKDLNTLEWNFDKVTTTKDMFKNSDFVGSTWIKNWFNGTNVLEDASGMFEGTTRFNAYGIELWDLSTTTNISKLFKNSIYNKNIGGLDVSNIEDASSLFEGNVHFNRNIPDLKWDKLKNASAMFKDSAFNFCSLNRWFSSSFTTNIVIEDISNMFENSAYDKSIGGWNTATVTNVSGLLKNLKTSKPGGVQNWNFSNVTDASSMFEGNETFDGDPAGMNWSSLVNASSMFKDSTFNGWIKKWFENANSLEDTSYMFENVSFSESNGDPKAINWLPWNMDSVKNARGMFKGSDFTGTHFVHGQSAYWMANFFGPGSVIEDVSEMFEGCTKFNEYIGSWNTSSVTNMSNLFKDTTLYNKGIANWDVSSVVDASGMFEGSKAFNCPISDLTWTSLENASSMFKNSEAFAGYITKWFLNPNNLTNTSNMFEGVTRFQANPNFNFLKWNLDKVTTTKEMFKNSDFGGGGWMENRLANPNVLEDMSGMFEGTTHFNTWIQNWDVSKVKDMSNLFKNSIYNQNLNGWDVSSIENISSLFEGNTAFNKGLGKWNSKLNNLKYKDNYSNGNFSLTFQDYELNASVSTNGLQLTMSTNLSSNLDFWTYQIDSGTETIANDSSVSIELDPGTYNVKVHGYINNLSGEDLKSSLMSTFSLSEAEVLTSGTLPTSLSSRI